MLPFLLSIALADSDHLGGQDTYNNQGDMLKLLVIDVAEPAVVTGLAFTVYAANGGDITLTLYRELDGAYVLEESVDATGMPDEGPGAAESGPIGWVLEPDETYAIGAYLEGSWYYYYSERGTDDPWFGEVVGSLRYEDDAAPSRFEADLETYFYDLVVDSQPLDADGDGFDAVEWGGDDCDDTDATVGAPVAEVPYDGLDQDCDGADLRDVDGDGVDAKAVGGLDCADDDAAIGPKMKDTCGDGIDQDCNGADVECPGGGGDGLDASPGGCGCDAGGAPGGVGLGVLVALAAGVRRRSARSRRGA